MKIILDFMRWHGFFRISCCLWKALLCANVIFTFRMTEFGRYFVPLQLEKRIVNQFPSSI